MSIKKNIIRIWGLSIIPLSFVLPRNKKIWLFGSNMGYTGNAKHLYIYVNENYKNKLRPYWISDSKYEINKLKSLGLPTAYKWSVKGLYLALRAKVFLYNSYISDVNEYAFGNVVRFNLWHGVALKHIERTKKNPDKKYVTKNPFVKFRYFRFLIKPTYVLTSSPVQTELFSRSFAVHHSQCVECTYPRNEILKLELPELRSYINRNEYNPQIKMLFDKINEYDNRFIYMPTWRDSGRNFLEQIGLDLVKLDNTLREIKGCLLIKLHPATKLNVDANKLTNIILLNRNIDIYPLLPLTDCLITDYSSIYFDYVLMKMKQIIFYIPDYEEYISSDRDFAFPFEESIEGKKVFNFDELIQFIKEFNNSRNNSPSPYNNKKFWDPKLNGNKELVNYIVTAIS